MCANVYFTLAQLLTAIAIVANSEGTMAQSGNKPRAMLSAPTVLLGQITVDDVPHSATGTSVLNLGPGKHRIEFQYDAPGFDSSEWIRFRFRLEGLDSSWVDAGNRRRALYSYLPPGSYLFQVTACNADGVWNSTGASIGLTISKYFWQTSWFLGLLALTLLALACVGFRLVVKR